MDNAVMVQVVRWGVFGVAFLGVIIALANTGAQPMTSRALLFASIVVVLIFFVLELAQLGSSGAGASYGWVTVLLGADGRFSTSKATIWLWTVGLAYALLFVAGIGMFVHPPDKQLFSTDNWNDYLILLGGPFAAAVLAKFAVVTKLNNGTADKTLVSGTSNSLALGGGQPGTSTGLADVVNNDDGNLDLVDTQYVVFNLVAFAYAAGTFISNNFNSSIDAAHGKYLLPTIPPPLLALTGAAAATYVGNKAVQKTGPKITSVTPTPTVTPAGTVTITGANLVPVGTNAAKAAEQTTVWLATADGTRTESVGAMTATPKKVTFVMPLGFPPGADVELYVVSAGGVPSSAATITLA